MTEDPTPSPPPSDAATRASSPTVRVELPVLPRRLASQGEHDQRYRTRGALGRGGMGEVKLVEDGLIGREVAVKTITSVLANDATMRERFLREVRIQGQLEHPSIVPVYDLGVDESGSDYFTMKRIAGQTLAGVVRSLAEGDEAAVAKFPRNALLAIFRQVCLAVAYAHSRGVVHRDLKPANIMVGDFGEVYVLDWGIARILGESAAHEREQILGSPGYMAPEQLADASDADERADIYALGAILFELLTLEPWHKAKTIVEAIASRSSKERARPVESAPERDIPPELDDLCARATANDRGERIQSARELAELVERYLDGDRDLERRRALAQRHAEAARAARESIAAGGPAAMAARREALREAGRAIALDPDGREGLRAAIELMLEPPPEMPAEVKGEVERAQSDRIRAGLLPGIVVFATFMIAALLLPLVAGAVSWRVPIVVSAALSVAIGLCVWLVRVKNLATELWGTLGLVAAVATAIAFVSAYLGPMMIVPPLAVALGTALAASQVRWRAFLALTLLGVVIPYVLEWSGVVSRSYVFSDGGLAMRSVVMQLSEMPIRVVGLFTTVVALVGAVLYVRRVVVVEAELRRNWILQNWHLRQMAQLG